MIRPITALCALAACASGLYLYQSKHRAHVLDSQIEDVIHQTAQLRARTRVLQAEWMVLNDPQRLQALAGQLLTLKPMAPAQFTTMADLDARLPPVGPPPPGAVAPVDPGASTDGPVVASIMAMPGATPAADGTTAVGATAGTADATPGATPVVAASAPVAGLMAEAQAATPSHPGTDRAGADNGAAMPVPVGADQAGRDHAAADHGVIDRAQTRRDRPAPERMASAVPVAPLPRALSPHPDAYHPARPRPVATRPVSRAAAPHPAAPNYARTTPVAHAPAPRPAIGGSLLGMAHEGLAPPAPVAAPVTGPVSQAAWTGNR